MTATLDRTTADRLAKLCGLFGSDHDGERATAAAMADRLIRAAGLTWADVIAPRAAPAPALAAPREAASGDWRAVATACRQRHDLLTAWESKFLASLIGHRRPTAKQLSVLSNIAAKVFGAAEAGRSAP